ncbi:ATP-binding protein [Microvirga tunisiensis]|nr:ATP-binding protein [Microvirga tunisiensis]
MARRMSGAIPINVIPAEYRPAILEEYKGNPLIEALPPLTDISDLMRAFGRFPLVSDEERTLSPVMRMQAISRLDNYLEPLPQHFEVADTLNLILRGGYVHRNPLRPDYRAELIRLYRHSLDGDRRSLFAAPPSTAPSFALFGISGLGKSTVIEQTLSFLPQALLHKKYKFLQLVWLKLDCPGGGSIKQLLLALTEAIDSLIGTKYKPRRLRDTSVEEFIIEAAKIAARHYLGVLVIDEIQNLLAAKGVGVETLLNFLVMFQNIAKIPIVFIGTPQALSVLADRIHLRWLR